MQQVAGMREQARHTIGDGHAPCRRPHVQRAQGGEVVAERARMQATELVLAARRCRIQREVGDGLAEVAHV